MQMANATDSYMEEKIFTFIIKVKATITMVFPKYLYSSAASAIIPAIDSKTFSGGLHVRLKKIAVPRPLTGFIFLKNTENIRT